MTSAAQMAHNRAIAKKGGQTRAKQFTTEFQKAARANVPTATLQANGRKGIQVVREKYGKDFAARKLADWRRANPSALERAVMAWLDEAGEVYAREQAVETYYVDFIIRTTAVEVDGARWHTANDHIGEERLAHHARKDQALRAAGYHLVHLSEQAILDGTARELLFREIRYADRHSPPTNSTE